MSKKLQFSAIALFKKNKILLQHRDNNTSFCPNMWGFFGGAIEKDETPITTAKRELFEELQIKNRELILFKKYTFTSNGIAKDFYVFIGKLKESIEALKTNQREGDDLGVFSKQELKNLDMIIEAKIISNDLFKNL